MRAARGDPALNPKLGLTVEIWLSGGTFDLPFAPKGYTLDPSVLLD